MGTYACWVLWIGFTNKALDFNNLPATTRKWLKDVGCELNGKITEHIAFENIYLHGKLVGFGTVLKRLHWECEIGRNNLFDPTLLIATTALLTKVQKIFSEHMLPEPKIYNHIDLGG